MITRSCRKLLAVALLLSLVFCAVSCRKGGCANGGDDSDDQSRLSSLAMIDDMLDNMSPTVKDSILNGMHYSTDSLQWCEYAVRLARYYFKSNQPDSMKLYSEPVMRYMEAQPVTRRNNAVLGIAYECEAGQMQLTKRGVSDVISLHRKAYSKLLDSDDKSSLSDIAANLGDAYYMNNDMPKAASFYRKALFLVDSLQLPQEKNITLYMGLARIYESLGDLSEAERFYKRSEKFLGKMQSNMQTYFLSSMGTYYYKTRRYATSLAYFNRMERHVMKTEGDSCYDMALCRINTADVLLHMDRVEQAERYLDLAEPLFQRENITVALHYANSIRIGIMLKRKRYEDVERILHSEHIEGAIDYPIQKIRNACLRDYYVAVGNPAAALANKIQEDEKDDSIACSNSYMRASEVIQRFSEDTLALHHDIEMAKKERKAQEDQQAIIILSAGIVILLLIFVVWWMYVRKRQVSAQMERFMLRLENTRNRISPHFIFNVLNNRIYTAGQKEKDELMALAQLIRRSLDISRNTFITLEEELDFVRKYVEVQSYVLRPDFEFRISTPDDITGIYIPSMSVQILAENAIKHGLKGLNHKQSLHINVERDAEGVVIVVEDNGRGFDSTRGGGNGLGMNIIRQTIAAVNRRSKCGKMDMDIMNTRDANGNVAGCRVSITIKGKININKL